MVAPILRDVELVLPRSGQAPSTPAAVPLGSEAYVRCYTGRHATNCYCVVDFGPTTAYGSTTPQSPTAGVHQLPIGPLTPGSTYHYRIRATDPTDVGNPTTSQDYAFTLTPNVLPSAGPTVTAVTAGTITATGATITWTSAPAAPLGSVLYATSPGVLDTSPTTIAETGSPPLTSHTRALTGLTTTTRYYYRVRQPNASGDVTLSPMASFVTT